MIFIAQCWKGGAFAKKEENMVSGNDAQRIYLPKRNRLIAALSDKIYVMETCRKSGTESTVENGIKYVREIIRGK